MTRRTTLLVALALSVGCEALDTKADTGASLQDTGTLVEDRSAVGGCAGQGVLVHYKEGGDGDDVAAVLAAQALGMEVRRTKYDEDLVLELTEAPPEVLVIDQPVGRPDDEDVLPHVEAFLAGGGQAIISLSDLHRPSAWNDVLGVDGVDQWDSRPLHPSPDAGVDLFSVHQELPAGLRGTASSWAIDGHALTRRDGSGEALAVYDSADGEEVAVLSMRGGQLLINGWFGDVFKHVDNHEDGILDNQELYENELVALTGCQP